MTPEARARQTIDALLMQAGWHVCNMGDANIHAARGVALREFPLNTGYGFADYLFYVLCRCDWVDTGQSQIQGLTKGVAKRKVSLGNFFSI